MHFNFPASTRQILFLTLLFLAILAHAIPGLSQGAVDPERVNLTSRLSYLEDPDGTLRLDDVRSARWANRFVKAPENLTSLNLGYSTSTYWIRFSLPPVHGGLYRRLLEAAYFGLDRLTLYTPEGEKLESGSRTPLRSRLLPHRYFIFPIEVERGVEQGDYYLRVYSSDTLILPLVLWQSEAFLRHVEFDYLMQGLYFGALVSLVIYNLLMFGALQDKKYLLYAAFIGSIGIAFFFYKGFGNQLTLPVPVIEYSTKVAFAVVSVFAFLFVMELLQTKTNYPQIHQINKLVIAVNVVTVLSPFLGISPQQSGLILSGSLVLTVLLALTLAIRSFLDKQPGSRYFLLAWSFFLLATLITSLNNFGVIPAHHSTINILQYSSVFDMLLLTLSISQRVDAERTEREEAVEEAGILKENLIRSLQVSGQQLEEQVRNRTKDLEDALIMEQETFSRYRKFEAMMTHEFRTPLAIIANQSQLALKELEHGIDNSVENMEVIQQAANRLGLLYSRMEAQDKELTFVRYNQRGSLCLSDWLEQIAKEMARGSSHQIEVRVAQSPVSVVANAFLLRVAVANLIDNAEKYSPPKSLIVLSLTLTPTHALIRVASQGQPIPARYREQIFEKHYRAPAHGNRPGRGLGLFIVKDIAESHRGSVFLEPSETGGNCFCISIPLAAESCR